MKIGRKLALTALVWVVAFGMSWPIVWMALTAFKTDLEAIRSPPRLLFSPTLENFASSNQNVSVLKPLLNSIVESGGATALCFLLALPAAYALAFHVGKARHSILFGMLMTRFMPGIGVTIPMYLLFKAGGLLDTRTGLVVIYALTNLPIVIWMLYSYLSEIPRDVLDNSWIDGASVRQQLVFVLLPLSMPGLCSTALLSVVLCWNEAFWSIQMTSSASAPLSAYIATLTGDLLWAKLSAASLLAVLPILALGCLMQRQLVRGLTFGAVR